MLVRRSRLLVVLLFAVVAAFATLAALWWTTGRSAGGQSLQSANLVPEDAIAYVAVDIDPTSTNWIALSRHLKRLGLDKKFEELRDDGLGENGLDWGRDIAPLLGNDAAAYFTVQGGSDPDGAVLIRVRDGAAAISRARQSLEREAAQDGATVQSETYSGVEIRYTREFGQDSAAIALVGDYLVAAERRGAIMNVIEVQQGRRKSLASRPNFLEMQRRTSAESLVFGYADGANAWSALQAAASGSGEDATAIANALGLSDGKDLSQSAGAFTLRAEKSGIRLEGLAITPPGSSLATAMPNYVPKLHQVAPGNSLLFISGYDLQSVITRPLGMMGSMMTGAGFPASGAGASTGIPEEIKDEIKAQFGIDIERDLLALLTKEYAVALPAPSLADPESISVLFAAEVSNPAHMDVTLSKLTQTFEREGLRVTKSQVGRAQTVAIEEPSSKNTVGFALRDNQLLVGYQASAVRDALLRTGGGSLAEDSDFIVTTSLLPNERSGLFYVSLRHAVALLQESMKGSSTMLPQDWENLKSLRGIAATTSSREGVRLFTGVLAIDSE